MAINSDKVKPKSSADELRDRFAQEAAVAATNVTIRWALIYLSFVGLGATCLITSMFTTGWYTYTGTHLLGSVSGDGMQRHQAWGFGLEGIWAEVEYCDVIRKTLCITDVDQFRFHDNARNPDAVKWKPDYATAALQVGNQADLLKVSFIANMVVALLSFASMMAAIKGMNASQKKWTRVIMVLSAMLSLASFVNVQLFMQSTVEFRELLLKKSFVSGVEGPAYTIGWSLIVAWVGELALALGIIPMIQVLRAFTLNEDAEAARLRERDARIQQYLNDLTNTSLQKEADPVDSLGFKEAGGVSAKYKGWTNDVESTRPCFTVEPSTGTFRVRSVEVEKPRKVCGFTCCCWFTFGMVKETIQQSAEEIQPHKAISDVRSRMIKKQALAPLPMKQPAMKMKVELAEDMEMNTLLQSQRPLSPKGPMGGTFGSGFQTKERTNLSLAATPLGANTPSMTGFRPGTGRPSAANGSLASFSPGMTMLLTGKNLHAEEEDDVAADTLMSPSGQPLAGRHRVVCRAPKPEHRGKQGKKELNISIGVG